MIPYVFECDMHDVETNYYYGGVFIHNALNIVTAMLSTVLE